MTAPLMKSAESITPSNEKHIGYGPVPRRQGGRTDERGQARTATNKEAQYRRSATHAETGDEVEVAVPLRSLASSLIAKFPAGDWVVVVMVRVPRGPIVAVLAQT